MLQYCSILALNCQTLPLYAPKFIFLQKFLLVKNRKKNMHYDKKYFLLVVKIEDFDLFVTEL